jgi:hypothetical protein
MDAFAKHAFLGEIDYQAQLAAFAAERLPTREDDFDSVDVWCAIQSILAAAGNVSKILWPVRSVREPRGVILRRLLDVANDNALADRSFRNTFEHYDERLEDWLAGRESAGYIDQLIGSSAGFPKDFSPNVHRAFDLDTMTLSYRGESVSLRTILAALDELRLKCRSLRYL